MQALLIIDMQNFVEDRIAQGVEFAPSSCIENMIEVVGHCRAQGKPIIHIRHESNVSGSTLSKNSVHAAPMPAFAPLKGETVFIKSTSSAFASTELCSYLQSAGLRHVAVIGAVAGYCVNSTVRAGADLGFTMTVIRDAIISFSLSEASLEASTVLDVTLGLLDGEFAQLVSTKELCSVY